MSSSGVGERKRERGEGIGQRERTQTSRPDLYSESKTFALPLEAPDASPYTQTRLCANLHACITMCIESISFLFSFCFALVDRGFAYTNLRMGIVPFYVENIRIFRLYLLSKRITSDANKIIIKDNRLGSLLTEIKKLSEYHCLEEFIFSFQN